jgi:methyltransferase (TIGR00027 family)
MASRGPEPLLDDPFAEPLVRAVGLAPFVRILDGDASLESDPLLNRKTRTEQMAVRTRFFDDFFTGATASGTKQAVILASGLDTRGYRLPWADGVVVYEIDQPQVIEFKSRTLADLGAAPTAELRTVAIDLREDWPAALRATGFDTSQPTAWSAEGLLPYLPADAQDRLFDNIKSLSAPGSQLATEHVPDPNVFTGERLKQISDRWRSFGFDLNAADLFYVGDRAVVVDYLTEHGWQVDAHRAKDLYARNGFEFPEEPSMEVFGEMSYVNATLT